MSAPGRIELEFLKFTPGPKGPSQYADNQGGFDLYNPPTDKVRNQGGNSGSSFNEVTFYIKGGRDVYETLFQCVGGNSVKTTSAQYKSLLMINNERQWRTDRTYKEITFYDCSEAPEGGEFEGGVMLICQYTEVDRNAKSFDKAGKAKPTVKTKIDLNRGKITAS
jgi:hypothetical protein